MGKKKSFKASKTRGKKKSRSLGPSQKKAIFFLGILGCLGLFAWAMGRRGPIPVVEPFPVVKIPMEEKPFEEANQYQDQAPALYRYLDRLSRKKGENPWPPPGSPKNKKNGQQPTKAPTKKGDQTQKAKPSEQGGAKKNDPKKGKRASDDKKKKLGDKESKKQAWVTGSAL